LLSDIGKGAVTPWGIQSTVTGFEQRVKIEWNILIEMANYGTVTTTTENPFSFSVSPVSVAVPGGSNPVV
jgi:hypothetical protein